jgi:catechol 2,3-dioxygenase-like lactoylglutathione lyase family enzyme
MATGFQVTFDCANPAKLAEFWAEVLGYKLDDPPPNFATWEEALKAWNIPEEKWNSASAIVDPEKVGPRVFFQQVPEAKVVKNRVHLDVRVSGGPGKSREERKVRFEAEAARLKEMGATEIRWVDEAIDFHLVMADPEGNEFCLT